MWRRSRNSPQQVCGQNQAGVVVHTAQHKVAIQARLEDKAVLRQARGMGQEQPQQIHPRQSSVPESA